MGSQAERERAGSDEQRERLPLPAVLTSRFREDEGSKRQVRRRAVANRMELLSFDREPRSERPAWVATAVLALERVLAPSAGAEGDGAGVGRVIDAASQMGARWIELLRLVTRLGAGGSFQIRLAKGDGLGRRPRLLLVPRLSSATEEEASTRMELLLAELAPVWLLNAPLFEFAPVVDPTAAEQLLEPWLPGGLVEIAARQEVGPGGLRVEPWKCDATGSSRVAQLLSTCSGPAALAITLRATELTAAERTWAWSVSGRDRRERCEVRVHLATETEVPETVTRLMAAELSSRHADETVELVRGLGATHGPMLDAYAWGQLDEPLGAGAPRGLARARHLLTLMEVARLAGLPTHHSVASIGVATLPGAPPDLPTAGGVAVGFVGACGVARHIHLAERDAAQHTHVCGVTGAGKSSLIRNLALGRIREGHGVAVADPHGDLALDLLASIPPERFDDVVIFDPTDVEWPVGLNLVEYDRRYPEQKSFVINELFRIFDALYNMALVSGPIFEQYFRNAFLALLDDPDRAADITLLSRFLTQSDYRKEILAPCSNPLVTSFWRKEAEQVGGEASLRNMAPYITSKVSSLIANDFLLPIVAQRRSGIDFRALMDERRILIVRLNKGRLGARSTRLIGMVLVMKLLMAAMSRADAPATERAPFHLFVDEFQTIVTPALAEMLAEARKYGLRLTLAHQTLAQVPPDLQAAVLGNVGTTIAFRVGPEDAGTLARAMGDPGLAVGLATLPNYQAVIRSTFGGEPARPFVFATCPPEPQGDSGTVDTLREASRRRYGRPRAEVLAELARRHE